MIVSYRDRKTERFADGKHVKEFPGFARQAESRLERLDAATSLKDLAALPGNKLEALKGNRQGQYSIRINDQRRICFEWPNTQRRGRPDQRRDCRLPLGGIMARTPIHPGEHLAEELKELSMSAAELARQIDVPVNRITGIINGQRAITADSALRLGHWFGTSPEFWLNLQKLYELRLAREEVGDRVERLPKLTERKRKKENGAPRLV